MTTTITERLHKLEDTRIVREFDLSLQLSRARRQRADDRRYTRGEMWHYVRLTLFMVVAWGLVIYVLVAAASTP